MENKYIRGSAKAFKSGDIAVDMLVADLEKIQNDKGYAKVIISKRQETDQYGNTHAIKINEWKPGDTPKAPVKRADVASKPSTKLSKPNYDQSDDLPF